MSNKVGTNIDILRKYIDHVHHFYETHDKLNQFYTMDGLKSTNIFSIDRSYQVNGVGTVISGKACNGAFKKGDTVYIGPFHGMWYPVTIRSFHDNFQQSIEHINLNESGCIAIKEYEYLFN